MPKKGRKMNKIKYGSSEYRALVEANDKERARRTGKRRTRSLDKVLGPRGSSKLNRRQG